jgi:hypothetical protein
MSAYGRSGRRVRHEKLRLMYALRIARVFLYAIAAALMALAVIRLVQDVGNTEGGGCGPGWTTEYEGPCDSALKARQYEVVTEALLALGLLALGAVALREDVR